MLGNTISVSQKMRIRDRRVHCTLYIVHCTDGSSPKILVLKKIYFYCTRKSAASSSVFPSACPNRVVFDDAQAMTGSMRNSFYLSITDSKKWFGPLLSFECPFRCWDKTIEIFDQTLRSEHRGVWYCKTAIKCEWSEPEAEKYFQDVMKIFPDLLGEEIWIVKYFQFDQTK